MDGVGYTAAQIRNLLHERHQLAAELTLVNDTLRRRTDAMHRVARENERLRAAQELP